MTKIPFNRPYLTGLEVAYFSDALNRRHLSGDGHYTKRCSFLLETITSAPKVLLTHSCTAALEMSAILANIGPGDEVIMPSFTFVSTANAFALRGATPVFVDIRPDTLNIDERKVDAAITKKTRAIVPVHYAGVSCEMTRLTEIAEKNGLALIEDAAQGLLSYYEDKHLGSIGSLGTISFHESKNIGAGEAGALLINDPNLIERAEIIREKGTNRSRFFRGQIDKYSWVDVGSSYLPPETTAAYLLAQLEHAEEITKKRLAIWNTYHQALAQFEAANRITRPAIPANAKHNAHIYYLLMENLSDRSKFIHHMSTRAISALFHYVPLHQSDFGKKIGRIAGTMSVTESIADRLVRLPVWPELEPLQKTVITAIHDFFESRA